MAGEIGIVAFEGELNAIVREYLECGVYEKTLRSFDEECALRGRPLAKELPGIDTTRKKNERIVEAQNGMMKAFKDGRRKDFFLLWEKFLPDTLRNTDPVAQKLEFYLQIYFAVTPLRNSLPWPPLSSRDNQSARATDRAPVEVRAARRAEAVEEAMAAFKDYLEHRGALLSQTTEFLPFYALPFVHNPSVHPTYKELFTDAWTNELYARLEKFLTLTLDTAKQPKLFDLYRGSSLVNKDFIDHNSELEKEVREGERRVALYRRRLEKLQSDYHNLIGITADLVDTLEATLQGKPIPSDYLPSICARLFARQQLDGVDLVTILSRPGTASAALRRSAKPTARTPAEAPPPPPPATAPTQPKTPQLDYNAYQPKLLYDKLKTNLAEADERRKLLLLQALRWRITKCPSEELRKRMVDAFIGADILGCSKAGDYRDAIVQSLHSPNPALRQYTARLFNTMASFCKGRAYLSQQSAVVQGLVDELKRSTQQKQAATAPPAPTAAAQTPRVDPVEALTREHILATLQKLSLRRSVQSALIAGGMINWLVGALENHEELSDFTLEYSVALLMNLCLRSKGKRACVADASRALRVLSALLGHQNQELVPYINGALYSVLGVPAIRAEAVRMGLEETLKLQMRTDQPENNRQLEFIIKQLHSEGDETARKSGTGETEGADSDAEMADDEFDDEEQDGVEPDLDLNEAVRTEAGERSGERLLLGEFYAPSRPPTSGGAARPSNGSRTGSARNANGGAIAGAGIASDTPLMRPVTPGARRAAAETFRKDSEDPVAAAAASPKTEAKQKSPPAGDAAGAVPPPTAGGTDGFSSRPKLPRTPHAGSASSSRGGGGGGGGTTPRTHGGGSNSPPNSPPKPTYSETLPNSRPGTASRPTSATAANGANKPK